MRLSRGLCRADNRRATGVFRNPWNRSRDGFVRGLFLCIRGKTRDVGGDGVFSFTAVCLWLFCQRARVVFIVLQSACLCVRQVGEAWETERTHVNFLDDAGVRLYCVFYADGQSFDSVLVWAVGERRAGVLFCVHTRYDFADGVYSGDGGRLVFALTTGVFHYQKRNVKGLPHGKPLLV